MVDGKGGQGWAWWRQVLGETAALFLLVLIGEYLCRGARFGAFGVHPHPYWLVVLPIAALRGTVAALVAATIATAIYALGAVEMLGTADPEVWLKLEHMREPVLFYGVGFFVGELRDHLEDRNAGLMESLLEMSARCDRMLRERGVLAAANRELEARLVHHTGQFSNLVAIATRLENASEAELYEIALELCEEHCGAAASVLMVLEDQDLDLRAHRGWSDDEAGWRLAAARTSELCRRAIADGVAVNGLERTGIRLGRGPLAAAPLFDGDRVVRALLVIDHLPASRLSQATIATFFGVAEWMSAALTRQTRETPEHSARPAAAGAATTVAVGSATELGERLAIEYDRCSRYGVPTSVMAVFASHRDGERPVEEILIDFAQGLRPSDTLFAFGFPGCWTFVLAGTPAPGAEIVRKRLLHRVEVSPVAAALESFEVLATAYDSAAPDPSALLEHLTLWFRARSTRSLEALCPVPLKESQDLLDAAAFARRLEVEISLARRLSLDLQVVGLCGERRDDASAQALARQVGALRGAVLRRADGAFAIGPHHCALVLPSTGRQQAILVARRLEDALLARDPSPPYGQLLTFVTALSRETADAASFLRLVKALPALEPSEVAP